MAVGPTTGKSKRAGGGAGYFRGVIAVTLAASLSGGCVSIRMEKPIASPAVYESGFLEVRVFESMSALRKGAPTKRQILSELLAVGGPQAGTAVHRSSEPVWALSDLPAGRYRLQVGGVVDEAGEVHSLGSSDRMGFDVAPGKGIRLSVILASGKGLAWNVAIGAGMVGWVILCAYLDTHGVPCRL